MKKKKINNKIINQYKDQSVIDALINNFEEKSSRIPLIKTFKKSLWIPILFFIFSMVILCIYNKNVLPISFFLPFIIYSIYIIHKINCSTLKQEITTLNNYILENHLNTVEIMQEIRLYCQKKEKNIESLFKISFFSFLIPTILSYIISNMFDLKFDSVYNAIYIIINIFIPVICIFMFLYTIIIAKSFSIRDYYTYKRLDTLLTELIIKKYQEKQ